MDRSHVKGILPQRLEEYMKEAQDDLKVSEINFKDKVLTRSSLGAKWCRYSFEEQRYKKKILNEIDNLREQIKINLYNQKKIAITNNNSQVEKLMALDAERTLVVDPKYKKLKQALTVQEDIVRLINEIQKQVSMFGYDITNIRETLKMENI